ncbi:MAG: hypothetical protein QNJ64_19550 [Crocosphaera sp.]|nr:hypothetical protein [Crocosphaera sp.]
MLLKVPTEIDNNRILWEGVLEPQDGNDSQQIKAISFESSPTNILPEVKIEEPLIYDLVNLYDDVPKWLASQLDKFTFYLVRFACSFRPEIDDFQFGQARFIVDFRQDLPNSQLVAVEMFPLEVNQKFDHSSKFTLSPNLKFMKVQGSLGGGEFAVEYSELQPTVIGTGVGKSPSCWEYRKVKGSYIQGSKFMFLLLKAPKEIDNLMTRISLETELEYKDDWITKLILPTPNMPGKPRNREIDLLTLL